MVKRNVSGRLYVFIFIYVYFAVIIFFMSRKKILFYVLPFALFLRLIIYRVILVYKIGEVRL